LQHITRVDRVNFVGYINDLAILINGPSEVMLFTIDLHKNFVDEKCITVALMRAFQSACINGTELDTPKPDRLSADGDATFREEIFNIAVA
jgi:hypothetical protein